MDLGLIDPELRATVRRLPPIPLHRRRILPLVRWFIRRSASVPTPPGIDVRDEAVGDASIRVYRPERDNPGAAILWAHGGGFIIGSARTDDRRCFRYVQEFGVVVVSVDYRLSPEHPFPAAADDCLAAWRWLLGSAECLGIGSDRIALAGESAGGGLAAALVQRIHDLGGVQPAAQLLLCPMLDDRTGARRELDKAAHRVWNNRANRAGWSSFLGGPAGAAVLPDYAVPARRVDVTGLPPSRIGVGDIDLFFEEDRTYHERLTAAGVASEFDVVPMAPHGFQNLVPDASVSIGFERRNDEFLRRTLGIQVASR